MDDKNRLEPHERKKQLLEQAVLLAEALGYQRITSKRVATLSGLKSHSLINHYFGTTEKLREAVLEEAIRTENLEIVLQGLVAKDPKALAAPQKLKQQALLKLSNE